MNLKSRLLSVLKGAAIAAAAAALTYAAAAVDTIPLGPWGPAVTAVLSIAINAVRKLMIPTPPTRRA